MLEDRALGIDTRFDLPEIDCHVQTGNLDRKTKRSRASSTSGKSKGFYSKVLRGGIWEGGA